MYKTFFDKLDILFQFSEEMVSGHGEDNYYSAYFGENAVVSVYDGCGGLGSRTYKELKDCTGAFIASRIASGAVHDWMHDIAIKKKVFSKSFLLDSLRDYIQSGYGVAEEYSENNLKISGSMVRDFPTTMAFAIAENHDMGVMLHVVWAGDSRVYLLNRDGIAQLTKDDVKSDDAMSNLSDDGALTNVLSSDGKYVLNYRSMLLREPAIILAATDGCFGYIPSPMEFEFEVLSAIGKSANADEMKANLHDAFGDAAGDDFSLGFMSFFYGSFENMRGSLENRFNVLGNEYIRSLRRDPENDELVMELWQKYRKNYERYLK